MMLYFDIIVVVLISCIYIVITFSARHPDLYRGLFSTFEMNDVNLLLHPADVSLEES